MRNSKMHNSDIAADVFNRVELGVKSKTNRLWKHWTWTTELYKQSRNYSAVSRSPYLGQKIPYRKKLRLNNEPMLKMFGVKFNKEHYCALLYSWWLANSRKRKSWHTQTIHNCSPWEKTCILLSLIRLFISSATFRGLRKKAASPALRPHQEKWIKYLIMKFLISIS